MGPPKKLILSILPLGIAGTAAVPIFLLSQFTKVLVSYILVFLLLFPDIILPAIDFNFNFRHPSLFTSFMFLSIDFYFPSRYSKYINIASNAEALFSEIKTPQKWLIPQEDIL